MTSYATPSSRGQTTIPKDIRESLGMKTGDRMTFALTSNDRCWIHPITIQSVGWNNSLLLTGCTER